MAIIMHSIDNNKTTVYHLAIPKKVSHLHWHRATGRRRRSPLSQSRRIEDSQA